MQKFNVTISSFFFFISFVFIIMIGGLYLQFASVIKQTNQEVYQIELSRATTLSTKISRYIKKEAPNGFIDTYKKKNLRKKLNSFLSLYITDEFKYIYMIYKDKYGSYRYLLDGSYGVDRGEFRQKFNPLLSDLWKKSFEVKKSVYGFQNKIDGLWVTYLHPIVTNNQIQAVLALDISTREYQNLNNFLNPLYSFLRVFLFVLVVIVLIIFIQTYMFYKVRKKSIIDPLTRLYNRNYLKEIWNKVNLEKIAILMVDIDFFKKINDAHGHFIGDMVISSVAKRLINETRLEDRVIRYGGEEFLIFLKWPKDDDEVLQIANRILTKISSESIRVDEDLNIFLTVSIGVNLNPAKSKSLKGAIDVADKMLYQAKKNGRNRVEFI